MVVKRIYIAGPMSGQLPRLSCCCAVLCCAVLCCAVLCAHGHHVENLAENPQPACGTWQGYMRMSLRQIAACDCLYMPARLARIPWRPH